MGELNIVSRSPDAFEDRVSAGQTLAKALAHYAGKDAVVLGILRGGVIVAAELSRALSAGLDIVLTRKLGAPGNPELAIGAVSEDGTVIVEQSTAAYVGATPAYIEQVRQQELAEIHRRAVVFRQVKPRLPLRGKIVIVADDGIATGATMQASLMSARHEQPEKLVAAVPVGPEDSLQRLAQYCDEFICYRCPPYFDAVGRFYRQFNQTTDEEVRDILQQFQEQMQR